MCSYLQVCALDMRSGHRFSMEVEGLEEERSYVQVCALDMRSGQRFSMHMEVEDLEEEQRSALDMRSGHRSSMEEEEYLKELDS